MSYSFVKEFKDPNLDRKVPLEFFQVAHFKHPRTLKYHIRKYIVDAKDNSHIINTIKDYNIDQKKYDLFIRNRKSYQYKLYNVYDLNTVNRPTNADFLLAKSLMVKKTEDIGGFAPFEV